MQFAWDPAKAIENEAKHGVTFDEGSTIFEDPFSITFSDHAHSYGEERYVQIGYSDRHRLLIVSYTERHGNVRIISARQATRRERRHYEEG